MVFLHIFKLPTGDTWIRFKLPISHSFYEGKRTQHDTSNKHFSLTLSHFSAPTDTRCHPFIESSKFECFAIAAEFRKCVWIKTYLAQIFMSLQTAVFFFDFFFGNLISVEYSIKIWTIWKPKLWLRLCKRQKPVSVDHLFITIIIMAISSERIEHKKHKKRGKKNHFMHIST